MEEHRELPMENIVSKTSRQVSRLLREAHRRYRRAWEVANPQPTRTHNSLSPYKDDGLPTSPTALRDCMKAVLSGSNMRKAGLSLRLT